jgi:hypothetical protein
MHGRGDIDRLLMKKPADRVVPDVQNDHADREERAHKLHVVVVLNVRAGRRDDLVLLVDQRLLHLRLQVQQVRLRRRLSLRVRDELVDQVLPQADDGRHRIRAGGGRSYNTRHGSQFRASLKLRADLQDRPYVLLCGELVGIDVEQRRDNEIDVRVREGRARGSRRVPGFARERRIGHRAWRHERRLRLWIGDDRPCEGQAVRVVGGRIRLVGHVHGRGQQRSGQLIQVSLIADDFRLLCSGGCHLFQFPFCLGLRTQKIKSGIICFAKSSGT